MTSTQAREIVTAACIAANPDIMKLEFGCKVELFDMEAKYIGYYKTDYTDLDARVMTLRDGAFCRGGKIQKILGRDLTLADVILAIRKIIGEDETRDDSEIYFSTGKLIEIWNLRLPFHLQSDETKIFLATLLEK